MASSVVSDEDLDKKRNQAQKLREQIADATASAADNAKAAENEIVSTQLDSEIANLQAQLRQVKGAATKTAVKADASGPLAQAKEQLAAATAASEAPVGAVDTNADVSDTANEKE